MIVLDAQCLVALFADEPAAPEVEAILERSGAVVTSVNLAEALDVSERVLRIDGGLVRTAVASLRETRLHVVACTDEDAVKAGALRARRYHRQRAAISIGDSFLIAAAGPGDAVASSDPAVVDVARLEGLDVIPLPDARGRRPA